MHHLSRSGLSLLLVFLLGWLPIQAQAEMSARDVDLRIDTFDEIDRLFKALRFKVVNQRSTDRQGAMVYSSELVRLGYRLPDLFDHPSPREMFPQSRARPEIWNRKDRYDFLMDEFLDNLEKIHEDLSAGRMSQAGQLIDRTAQGCRRCHNTFRYR
ncbi:cytochrome c [Marinospirillum alkaliphilum]|uniref:Cytochrome c556 n=1 Tax=Marinospirillum alkaliphilum DSM 21637 TaxID=1122209 RepID=A0A1K1XKI8_9GAMM|nr:cytochrome c [Marinospirillum alkaliphilum]SFX50234.1 Cytochrome c556 [Marinospirillum alkaliphilum DSM 21637]